jgi:hypothetical protein
MPRRNWLQVIDFKVVARDGIGTADASLFRAPTESGEVV